MFRQHLLLLQILILFFTHGFCQTDCVLKKSQDSIFVYTCRVPDLNLKSIRATFKIKTTPSVLAAWLLDVPGYIHWQYNTIEADVLKRVSANEIIYRSEIEAPWPVSNRDLVVRLKITQDPVSRVMIIDLKSMLGYTPEKKGVVRIPFAEGQWVVEPLGKEEVLINYHFLVDPGGVVPVWLINLALAEGPYETFRNLTERIKAGRIPY